jgi:hypothetical protein
MFAPGPAGHDAAMAQVTTPRLTVRRAGERSMVNVTYYIVFNELDVELDQPYSEVCEVVGDGRVSTSATVIRSGGAQWLCRSFTRMMAGGAVAAEALRAKVTLAAAPSGA